MFAKLFEALLQEVSRMIRREVDYLTQTIKTDIETSIIDSYELVRRYAFFLTIAIGTTLIGLVFATWGIAQIAGEYLGSEGKGYLIFGALLMLVGLISLALSKPKERK